MILNCYRICNVQVLRCSKITAVKVAEITELIQKALENDQKLR